MSDLLGEIIRRHARPLEPIPTNESPRLSKLPGIRAVIFDIYGTLLISASGDIGLSSARGTSDTAIDRWVSELGFTPPVHGVRAALADAIKKAHQHARAQGAGCPEVVIEEIWGQLYPHATDAELRRLALAYELRVNPVWPMPGLASCLESLRKTSVRLGIVSNAQFYTPLILAHFLEGPLHQSGFLENLCFFSYRLGRAKPGAALYQAAKMGLQECGIAPCEAVMVGNDRRNDVAAARLAGFQTVLFAGDQRSLRWRRDDPDWATAQPDMVITDLRQLSEHLQMK